MSGRARVRLHYEVGRLNVSGAIVILPRDVGDDYRLNGVGGRTNDEYLLLLIDGCYVGDVFMRSHHLRWVSKPLTLTCLGIRS